MHFAGMYGKVESAQDFFAVDAHAGFSTFKSASFILVCLLSAHGVLKCYFEELLGFDGEFHG